MDDDKDDFCKRLEWQLKVEDEGVAALEKAAAPPEEINEARKVRDRTTNTLNAFGGPAIKEKKKNNCFFFVRKGNR